MKGTKGPNFAMNSSLHNVEVIIANFILVKPRFVNRTPTPERVAKIGDKM